MPINNCSNDGKPGYKWGDSGACYTYTQGDKGSMDAARKKALAQATAMGEFKVEKTTEEISLQLAEDVVDLYIIQKSLTQWFKEKWVDLSRPKAGGGYRTVSKSIDLSKVAEDLAEEEAMLADALTAIARIYGKFNEDATGIWAGYDSPEENDVKEIGVKCSNCVLYEGNGVCKIIAQKVEDEGVCRFAIIPDGVVQIDDSETGNHGVYKNI